ncbi:uncharacterized protein LOC114871175 isoform X1 [Osmia bicornis bicornis]|uniref:uncharacterized protein LOC114871175 isoform X1 n=1 Tax=Osmia bicornis bicornis TaxID=1437191 RepID=UPI001EAED623|nr:uncharacterized protein LOC114871175 isoform X1 [Osmia bicornis bicornis]
MEIKNSTDMIEENGNTTVNVTSTFENYPFSWIALQQNSKYKNVINAINQLLSMYHPDDGINAYEHVLKTLLVLSENFDSNMQEYIISTIPLPKGASDIAIKDIICKTIDLIKSANNMAAYQNSVPENKFHTEGLDEKSKMHLNQNILVNTSSQNFEFISSVPEVFRGFPPNEISMIHSHVKNVNYVYNTLDNNIPHIEACINIKQNFLSNVNEEEESLKLQSKLEWLQTPHFQLSIDKFNNYNHCNIANVHRTLYQDNTYFKRKLYKNGVILNKQDKSGISNLRGTHNSKYSLKSEMNCKAVYNEDLNQDLKKNKIINEEMYKYYVQELRNEQVIQQDIYKMDVVCYDEKEKDTVMNSKTLEENNFITNNFAAHRKLKKSLYSFLKRAEQEILIEVPIFPQIKSVHIAPPISKCWDSVTEKNLENKNQLDFILNTKKYVNVSENINKYTEKKPLRSMNIYPKSAQLQVLHRNLNTVIGKTQAIECEKKDNIEHLQYKYTVKQTKQNNCNTLQQSASITKLATFKKQYYDTLLNIQKAKVAVANSMALSSVETSTKYDPCYSAHLYQQQLLQKHEQLTGNPQFAVHSVTQSGLSNMYNTPYTWVQYDWRHPKAKQLRFSQEFPLQLSRNRE